MKAAIESRNLDHLASYLERTFAQQPPIGAVVGRTRMRDAIALHLRCSQLEAEQLVDAMVAKSKLVFEGSGGEPGVWHIRPRQS